MIVSVFVTNPLKLDKRYFDPNDSASMMELLLQVLVLGIPEFIAITSLMSNI